MYSSKKNVLETVALLKAHGITHVVLSPGSRNAPLIQSFTTDPDFICWSVVDERSAGYFAIGLIYQIRRPVVVCCTSGSALLNYGPAIAETFYQKLPLIVISADRSSAWIEQMDGQTIPQTNLLQSILKKTVHLPEIIDNESHWYCNRLINEALIASVHGDAGPVLINVPISEPLFDFYTEKLPNVRCIRSVSSDAPVCIDDFINTWKASRKRIILVGQQGKDESLTRILELLTNHTDCVVLCEHLSNQTAPSFISNFDVLIKNAMPADRTPFEPDLLITLGGHIVSKQLKKWFREHHPAFHWQIAASLTMADTYQSVTNLVEANPVHFLNRLFAAIEPETERPYTTHWEKASASIDQPDNTIPFSDISVTGAFLRKLPSHSSLIVGNSSPVRNIQLFSLPTASEIFCNRGTNGIEGLLSTAIGYALVNKGLTFLLTGDLSFFHDLGGLWSNYPVSNLRILVINNGGGGIFHLLNDLEQSDSLQQYVAAKHDKKTEAWVKAAGMNYLQAYDEVSLEEGLETFVHSGTKESIVLEVFTTIEANKSAEIAYHSSIKQR